MTITLNRMHTIKHFALALSILLAAPAKQISCQTGTGAKAKWITAIRPDTSSLSFVEQSSGGYYYLLVDFQENIKEEVIYCHYVIKLLNNNGVQNMSDISVDYDPNYQTLTLHEISRFRAGVKTNELERHEIKTIQREQEMSRFLYDGRLTSYVNLEDIREGDILEYSYSIKGYNPINKGHYFKTVNLEYNDPVRLIYRRILAPKDLNLFFSYPAGSADPDVQVLANNREYVWKVTNAPALIYENNVPAWFNANRRIEISTMNKWSDLVNLCLPDYMITDKERTNLKNAASDLLAGGLSDSLILSVVRFVQDEIRYLGFESGLDAYRPMQPVAVLKSRFADCKAKSLLLCSLLDIAGVEANPVLVSSNQIKSQDSLLPSRVVFNHVVVQIIYKDSVHYIDPTISNQGGRLNSTYFPNYGYGLVLKKGSESLTLLSDNSHSETRVSNYFKIDTIGKAATLKVITEYSGFYADDTRSSYKNSSLEETTNNYLKFYSKSYPHIKSSGLIKFTDNREDNIFSVEENYVVDSIWTPVSGKANKLEMNTGAMIISSAASIPASPERVMPYLISYPVDCTEEFYIYLPSEWSVTPQKTEITDSLFYFIYTSDYDDKRIHLKYSYKTNNDFVEAGRFKEFYSKHEKISDNLYYNLSHTKGTDSTYSFSWVIMFIYLILTAVGIVIGILIYKKYNIPPSSTASQEIGGWLIVVALGLIISFYKVAYSLYFDGNYFNQETWTTIFNSDNKTALLSIVAIEFIYNSFLLVYIVFLLILFFNKRSIVPRLAIIFYVVNAVMLVLDTFFAQVVMPDNYTTEEINKSYLEIVRTLVFTIIWTSYFIFSKRVKETFTKTYKGNELNNQYSDPSKPGNLST